ncbi:hypothetical protein [Marinicella litoralis]|uniref:Uncharacterized protein n=1 Tax=Marinicella litoralis TaxID=644220 RepID=A0A4R6XJY0_9GAMM|nr:hypothetical protein [Marinicella litoralis]TDR17553.1 hypothetical protein C8D91_2612 [Marinicella litoralis]
MKKILILFLSILSFSLLGKGKYEVREEYSPTFENEGFNLHFTNLKVKSNGKMSGYLKNDSEYAIIWTWLDFDRFDKNGLHSKVSYSYPQLLFQNIGAKEEKKIKGISMVGVKWFKRYDFGPIISMEFENDYYLNFAHKLAKPFIIKRIEVDRNKSLDINEGFVEILNASDKVIKSINMSFYPLNSIVEKSTPFVPIEIEVLDRTPPGAISSKRFEIWDIENICVFPDLISIVYEDETILDLTEEQIIETVYLPSNKLYPTQNYDSIRCLNLINPN